MKTFNLIFCLFILFPLDSFSAAAGADPLFAPEEIKKLSVKKLRSLALPEETGDKDAQFWLGELSHSYTGKSKQREALNWWKFAALKDHDGAIQRLIEAPKARIISMIETAERNREFREAHKALYDSAKSGDASAYFEIGNKYDKDDSSVKFHHNGEKAIKYWSEAARRHFGDAIEKIYQLALASLS